MPIGAALGAAAVTAGGAVLSSSSQKKAANQASNTAAANTASNNALTRDIYDKNSANLLPYSQNGLRAGNALNDMLLGPAAPGTPGGATNWGAYLQGNPDVAAEGRRVVEAGEFRTPNDFAQWHYQNYGQGEGRQVTGPGQTAGQQSAPANGSAAPSAFDTWRNSTNYQFTMDQALKAGNQGYAANGMLESGAAMKGLQDRAATVANGYVGDYQNRLMQQQQIGMGAASALAGVGQNMVNNVTANNNSAAQTAAQAAIQNGAATGQMWAGIGSAAGQAAGAFGGSSYRIPY